MQEAQTFAGPLKRGTVLGEQGPNLRALSLTPGRGVGIELNSRTPTGGPRANAHWGTRLLSDVSRESADGVFAEGSSCSTARAYPVLFVSLLFANGMCWNGSWKSYPAPALKWSWGAQGRFPQPSLSPDGCTSAAVSGLT